jgi:Putative DNA-binding domain
MADDLYRVDLRSISGTDLYRLISEFTRTDQTADERPREGYLLDFKEGLSERFLRTVASFANTFGGLLILGVSEADGRPEKLVGVTVPNELKTQVSNFIASNLFPCPPFEIAECSLPEEPGKKLCVVRIRETAEICLLAKKGEPHPIYIRIEDTSIPPDASNLRSLLDRKRDSTRTGSLLESRLEPLRQDLFVTTAGPHGPRARSATFFRVILYPHAQVAAPLDLDSERKFFTSISAQNPGLQSLVDAGVATAKHSRGRDWSELRFLDQQFDYERRWRVGTAGEIALVTQTRWPLDGSDLWSINDVARDIARIARLAETFWQYVGFYGSFRLDAELKVGGLRLAVGNQCFEALFYYRLSTANSHPLDRRSIVIVPDAQMAARAEIDLAYDALAVSLPHTTSIVLNELLRGLGHVANLQKLRQDVNF